LLCNIFQAKSGNQWAVSDITDRSILEFHKIGRNLTGQGTVKFSTTLLHGVYLFISCGL